MISSAPSPNLELRHGFSGKWKRAVDGYDGVPGWGAELLKKYSRRGRRVVVEEGKGEEVAALSASPEQPRKACAECKTSKTPMWRSGPHGPKSLCNACGIRVKKRESKEMKGEKKGISSSSSNNKWLSQEEMRNRKRETQERRMLFLMTKRQRQREEELRRKASTAMMKPKEGRGKRKVIVGGGGGGNERREAEQAAHLLLSLSSAVFVRS